MRSILPIIVALSLAAIGCGILAGDVATDPQFVPAGTPMIDTGVDIVDGAGFDTGRNYVLVDATLDLPDEAPVIDPEKVQAGDKNAVAAVWGALSGFVPEPFRGIGALVLYGVARAAAGKRYRQNWVAAGKGLVTGDVKGAVRMAAAAEGIVHTTEDPAALRAVADRKAALAVVDDKHPAPVPAPA